MCRERRIFPRRRVGNRDDILVRRKHDGLERSIGALDSVHQAEPVHFLHGGTRVAEGMGFSMGFLGSVRWRRLLTR